MFVNNSFDPHASDDYEDDSSAHRELPDNQTTTTVRLVTFFISIPICLVAVLINILLIFVILRYKALKTRGNYYILNFCVCNILFLTAEHILHLSMDLFFGGWLEVRWYCTFIQLENYFLDMCIIFIAGYTVDEYIVSSASDYFLYMYKNGFKYIIGSVYPVHFIIAFIVTGVCFSKRYDVRFHISFIFATIAYAACLATIIKIKCDCRKSTFKNNRYLRQALSISFVVLLFFLPLFFYYNALSIAERIIDDLEVFRTIAFIPEYMAYIATYVLAYKLFRENKFFKLAVCKVFRRSNNELDFSRLDVLPDSDIDKK